MPSLWVVSLDIKAWGSVEASFWGVLGWEGSGTGDDLLQVKREQLLPVLRRRVEALRTSLCKVFLGGRVGLVWYLVEE